MNCFLSKKRSPKSIPNIEKRDDDGHTRSSQRHVNKTINVDHQGSCYETNAKIDLLTRLPDDILRKIVSSLSTKEAIRTSILCSNLISIWKSIENVQMNCNDIFNLVARHYKNSDKDLRLSIGTDRIHKVLSTIDQNSDKVFKLKVENISNISVHANDLIDLLARFCLDHYVEDAALDFELNPDCYFYEVPLCEVSLDIDHFLSVRSLRSLSVHGCNIRFYSLENHIWQPSFLNVLVLVEVHIVGNEFEDLLSKCPSLTSLTLLSYTALLTDPITINHSKLRSLVVQWYKGLKFNTPGLKVLEFSNWTYSRVGPSFWRVYEFEDISSLIKCRFSCSESDYPPFNLLLWFALYDLRHVKTIQFNLNCIKGLPLLDTNSMISIAMKCNFQKLKLLLNDGSIDFGSIATVLTLFSRIQRLVIRMEENCCFCRLRGKLRVALEKAFNGMKELHEVSIYDFRQELDELPGKKKYQWRQAFKVEFKFIQILMQSLRNLEKITVHLSKDMVERAPTSFVSWLTSHFYRINQNLSNASPYVLHLVYV